MRKGFFVFFISVSLFIPGFLSDAIGKDTKDAMEVTRDKDKTTYTIGPSENKKDGKTEEEKDKERAWDMLKRMNIIIDKRGQNGQQGGQ